MMPKIDPLQPLLNGSRSAVAVFHVGKRRRRLMELGQRLKSGRHFFCRYVAGFDRLARQPRR